MFAGLKRMLGQKDEGQAFIETRLDRFGTAGPPPPPPPPPVAVTTGRPIATADPLGSGLPPLAPPAPAQSPAMSPGGAPFTPPAPVPAVDEEFAPTPSPQQPVARPKARPSGANVRLLMADGSSSELDDPELAARAEYLVRNLLNPKPPEPKS